MMLLRHGSPGTACRKVPWLAAAAACVLIFFAARGTAAIASADLGRAGRTSDRLSVPGPDRLPNPSRDQVCDDELLRTLLGRAAEYCEKLKRYAFHYVCLEKVVARRYKYATRRARIPELETEAEGTKTRVFRRRYDPRGSEVHRYLFDFQLIKEKDQPVELRTLLEEDGRKRNRSGADLPGQSVDRGVRIGWLPLGSPPGHRTGQERPSRDIRFNVRYLVFGPVGFLSESWQPVFHYAIDGREEVDGRPAVIIRCMSLVERENVNDGRVWVAPDDGAILRIEWEPRSVEGWDEEAPEGYRRALRWQVTYGVEKNGVRFPSRQEVRESLVDWAGRPVPTDEIAIDYVDYKFFIVEVDVEIKPPADSRSIAAQIRKPRCSS